MNNRRFYNFCRDQRKREKDDFKKEALKEMYDYLRECGVSRMGVSYFIGERIRQEEKANNPRLVEAYKWLREAFEKPAPAMPPPGQGALL